ncbi:MAG TPA: ABC transporter ATP-binding protein [Candidatus Saccharibacteria bacterium]|nr:ABC transporter ATP-binding protein [Candidatus Saccharibacteria bacterium]
MKEKEIEQSSVSIKRRLSLVFRMFSISFRLRPSMVLMFFFGAALEIGGFIASVYATARLGALVAGFVTTGSTDYIWLWLWIDIFAALVIGMGFLAMSYAKRMLYFVFVRWTTNVFLSTLCSIDLGDFYNEQRRNQINKVGGGYTWQLPNLSDANLDLGYGILRFLAITVVVAQISWWIVPMIALFLIPSLLAESRLAKMQWFVWDQKGDERHVFWGLDWLIKQAKGQMELRSSQARSYVLKKVDDMNLTFYGTQEKQFKQANKALVPTKILETAGTAIGSISLLKQFLAGSISLERYFFLSGALLRVGGALNTIFATLSRMQEMLLFADSFFLLIDSKPKIVDSKNAIMLDSKKTPEIMFNNISFSYPEHSVPIFDNLNLTIKAGEHVALVGENGAGKSTLIKLLLRYYKPTSGKITINGTDINDIAIESWYEHIATLFQDFNQYPMPIDENIYIGKPGKKPDQTRLEEAANMGGVSKIIKNYEHGWDTVLDSSFKKGVEPSGGQWQRVALSRAFYRDANVLILDEPTSAIDAKAEYEIFNNIFEHYKTKTALIVSHRFSTVRRADRIVVLDHGNIVEQGSHKELLDKKGMYSDLFSKQAEGYR